MSGAGIAAEVAAAIRSAAAEVGGGTALIATLTRKANATTPWGVGGAAQIAEIAVLVSTYNLSLINGENIRADDRKVMAEATGVIPTTADRLEIDGVTYSIISVQPAAPGGTDLYYTLQCRA